MTIELLQETCDALDEAGKSPMDIYWIGSRSGAFACTWEEFGALARVRYDNGFGSSQVATDLVIVFKDGSWLERGEYDGSEWWQFKKTPKLQEHPKKIESLFINWGKLDEDGR